MQTSKGEIMEMVPTGKDMLVGDLESKSGQRDEQLRRVYMPIFFLRPSCKSHS